MSPDERIEVIERSLSCFRYGAACMAPMVAMPVAAVMMFNSQHTIRLIGAALGGLIVLVSLPLSLMAARNYLRARAVSKKPWEGARNTRLSGEIMSSLGVLFCLVLLLLIACVYMDVMPN
jgi:hypothetical protein